jgi:hypothetical protein
VEPISTNYITAIICNLNNREAAVLANGSRQKAALGREKEEM